MNEIEYLIRMRKDEKTILLHIPDESISTNYVTYMLNQLILTGWIDYYELSGVKSKPMEPAQL